jgi:phosphate starvation-inducible membrane PsiE
MQFGFESKSNGAKGGQDFLGKYFSLGFVTTVRFAVYLMPIAIVYFLVFPPASEVEIHTTWIDVVIFDGWLALLYWRLCVHIKQTNS